MRLINSHTSELDNALQVLNPSSMAHNSTKV